MGDKTEIEWTDASWNPVVGCSIVSAGCTNCYAMKLAARLLDKPDSHYEGTTKKVNGNAVWTGKLSLAPDNILTQPLRWKRPRRIFVNSMGDLFHEDVPDAWIDQVFAVMRLAPQHTFQILTKRADRMLAYCNGSIEEGVWVDNDAIAKYAPPLEERQEWTYPLPNVWLGVSVENQEQADKRVPDLLMTPAAVRFVSCEPLLGEVRLDRIAVRSNSGYKLDSLAGRLFKDIKGAFKYGPDNQRSLDWVIAGGESGVNARPMHPDWVYSLRYQCIGSKTPFFFKQWGEYEPMFPHYPEEYGKDDDWGDEVELGFPKEGILYSDGYFYNGIEHQAHVNRGAYWVRKVGKKKSGHLIDGKPWQNFPKGGA